MDLGRYYVGPSGFPRGVGWEARDGDNGGARVELFRATIRSEWRDAERAARAHAADLNASCGRPQAELPPV